VALRGIIAQHARQNVISNSIVDNEARQEVRSGCFRNARNDDARDHHDNYWKLELERKNVRDFSIESFSASPRLVDP